MGLGESFPRTTPSLQPPLCKTYSPRHQRPASRHPRTCLGFESFVFCMFFFVELSKAFEFDVLVLSLRMRGGGGMVADGGCMTKVMLTRILRC